jgi:hypothetical protein
VQWAREANIRPDALYMRIKRGWDPDWILMPFSGMAFWTDQDSDGRFAPILSWRPPSFSSILQLGTHGCGRRWPFSVGLSRRGLALPRPLLSWSFGRAGALPAYLPNCLPIAQLFGTAPPRPALASGVRLFAADRPHAAPALPRKAPERAGASTRDLGLHAQAAAAQRHASQEAVYSRA